MWNFTVDVVDPTLHVREPDGLIQDARWFPVEEASRLLRELPYRPLSEPQLRSSPVRLSRVPIGRISIQKQNRLSPTPMGEEHLPPPLSC